MAVVTGYVNGVPVQIEIETIDIGGNVYLEHETAVAFRAMREAASSVGIVLRANSGYRSFSHQKILYDQWLQGSRKCKPAKPGFSKHHTGRAVDINRSHDTDPDGAGPLLAPTDAWLLACAQNYFCFYKTIQGEPWHFEHIKS
jgi:LAS superfamily LD-carboxypeptidase LdcB